MNRAAVILAATVSPAAAGATDPADRLVVVHDTGETVFAAPHVERPAISRENADEALVRAARRLAEAAASVVPDVPELLPVKPDPLRRGSGSRIVVRGLARPVFALGSDAASLRWLAANAEELRASGARGFVVSAPSAGSLRRARAVAARLGLSLDPMSGAALADAYGARSYPFVAEPSP